MPQLNLLSSLEKKGDVVTEIVTGMGGIKKTFEGVITKTIVQGEFTHFDLEDGRTILVNTPNILWIEVFKE